MNPVVPQRRIPRILEIIVVVPHRRRDRATSGGEIECFNKDQRASRRELHRELDDQNDDVDGQPDRSFKGGAGLASGSSDESFCFVEMGQRQS